MSALSDPKIYLAAGLVCVVSVLPFNDGFYVLTRLVVSLSSAIAIRNLLKSEDSIAKAIRHWWIAFAILLILYNPVFPVYLREKFFWVVVNIATAYAFFWLYRKNRAEDTAIDRIFNDLGLFQNTQVPDSRNQRQPPSSSEPIPASPKAIDAEVLADGDFHKRVEDELLAGFRDSALWEIASEREPENGERAKAEYIRLRIRALRAVQ
ncbi:MAG: hypothetical protein FJ167_14025 [Gammaproteobacteria bacterium]|nr:hypothetical protein [Gammaproteobacteria bacterium]